MFSAQDTGTDRDTRALFSRGSRRQRQIVGQEVNGEHVRCAGAEKKINQRLGGRHLEVAGVGGWRRGDLSEGLMRELTAAGRGASR